METYEGKVSEVVFHNVETGYCVLKIMVAEWEISLVANIYRVRRGDRLAFEGTWIFHEKFGEQFQASNIRKLMPATLEEIEKFLKNWKDVSLTNLEIQRILNGFGEKSLSILLEYPEKWMAIEGMEEKALLIAEALKEEFDLDRIYAFCSQHTFPFSIAPKLRKAFQSSWEKEIKKNPYQLMQEPFGLRFDKVDKMAIQLGISQAAPARYEQCILKCLQEAATQGHTFLWMTDLQKKIRVFLEIEEQTLQDAIVALAVQKRIWWDRTQKQRVYLYTSYEAEQNIAQKIQSLANVIHPTQYTAIDQVLQSIELEEGVCFDERQTLAVQESFKRGLTVITGGPGTGKTTLMKTLLRVAHHDKQKVILTAPTGRAAKRLFESTGKESKTIHRVLEIEVNDANVERVFAKNEEKQLDADLVILDEASMVDVWMMSALCNALALHTRLVLVGDVNQLPSVGPGNVLKDILACGFVKTITLTAVFRQANQSYIRLNAHRVQQGKQLLQTEHASDFYFIKESSKENVLKKLEMLYGRFIPENLGLDPLKEVQMVSPSRKGDLGVLALNEVLQKWLNPPAPWKKEKKCFQGIFREGDKVMQTKNHYKMQWVSVEGAYEQTIHDLKRPLPLYVGKFFREPAFLKSQAKGLGVVNGDAGVIHTIDLQCGKMLVVYEDDRLVAYDLNALESLEHAYAMTVHKAQGAEFNTVILPIWEGSDILYTRSLLYTAITRGKHLTVIVGCEDAVNRMIRNDRLSNRFSSLHERLKR